MPSTTKAREDRQATGLEGWLRLKFSCSADKARRLAAYCREELGWDAE